MRIVSTDLEIQREPFARPFGFKGSAFHEKWNCLVRVEDTEGNASFGLGGLAVLWSDADVFSVHTEVGGNILQTAILEHALQRIKALDFETPIEALDLILPDIHAYAQSITQKADLRLTFTLIALVALDNALWMTYARQRNTNQFDQLIPSRFRPHFADKQQHLALAPAIGYNLPHSELRQMLEAGIYVLKIKIGQAGTETEMVEKDCQRLADVDRIAREYQTNMTDNGRIAYYLDANSRYPNRQSLMRLLDQADHIGCLDQIIVVEEPFDEGVVIEIGDLPICLAADESVHTIADVTKYGNQGYSAIAIKPAGKTLSLAFQMVSATIQKGMIPFVADNACVPTLVEWNKNIAARLPVFPGLKTGMMESNGPQNYATWSRMVSEYSIPNAPWLTTKQGSFQLNSSYYQQSGGIFRLPDTYTRLFRSLD